jgi:hypothetical protein
MHVGTGERIWWTWMRDEFEEDFKITELFKSLAGVKEGENSRKQTGKI